MEIEIKEDECIILNPTLNDLLENNLYRLIVNNHTYIVPLWHNELVYDNSGNDIYVKCNPILPENMEIDDANNIKIDINYKISEIWGVDTIYVNPNVGEQGDAIKDETSAYRPLSLDAMQIVVNEVAKFFGRPAPRVIMRPIGDISFDNELEKANHARSIVRLFRTINAEISAFPTKERDSLLIVSHGGSIDAMWKAPKSAKVSDIKQGRIATPEYCGYILINSKNEITPGNGVELLDIPGM
jgi:hypothetical protein